MPLSPEARAVLDSVPRFGPYVFTTRGRLPIGNFAKFKTAFDAAVLAELRKQDSEATPFPRWTLHDCRRTARSLMSRASVNPDVAERCLQHSLGGMRGVYDRYSFYSEKQYAFEVLAGLIDRIVHPPAEVVVPIRRQG